jgi:DNA-binding CsgD family transcriptional regulator
LQASESRQLAALVGETAVGGSGGAMILTAEGGARLFALVTPLPSHFSGQPGRVLVVLRSEAAAPALDAATLWRLFKLTPAEARLALAIAAGHSLGQIGREHHVSENTLRTQLVSILRKTDTANQRELVRMLSLLPPIHRPAAAPRPI